MSDARKKTPKAPPIKMPTSTIKGIGAMGIVVEKFGSPRVVPGQSGNPFPMYGWMGGYKTNM